MKTAFKPPKPLLLFDGDCGFCRAWIFRWRARTGDRVDYAPYQQVVGQFPEIAPEEFRTAAQLIETDGAVYSGAEAVLRALAFAPRGRWALAAYRRVPGFAATSRVAYRWIAGHRRGLSLLTRLLWGPGPTGSSYLLTRWLFLRLLGVIYLVAFLSLGSQFLGLVGEGGILPAGEYLARMHERLGDTAYRLLPTVCWWDAGDRTLLWLCRGGAVLSILLILDFAPALAAALLWVIYLSLSHVGNVFLSFQWDILLLETGLLAVFFAPWRLRPRLWSDAAPSRIMIGLLRWLLFRLMFLSGAVKLVGGDPVWRDLTALTVHYWTQPLPTWTAWYAHHLPLWWHQVCCAVMFGIELVVPFLFTAPRRPRQFAAAATVLLMVLIGATGNYNFFNLLTVALCVPLLDDRLLARFLPRRRRGPWMTDAYTTLCPMPAPQAPDSPAPSPACGHFVPLPPPPAAPRARFGRARAALHVALAMVVVTASLAEGVSRLGRRDLLPRWVQAWERHLSPFRSVNAYGLFQNMTTQRREIVFEGTRDGQTWLEYELPWKPGRVDRAPGFCAPHQPRLDWQLWFAALGSVRANPWVVSVMQRLLEGSPPVLALFAQNPFPDEPPRQVRAVVYDYTFTDHSSRQATGAWWNRKRLGLYCAPISRRAAH
ncbi:MAG: lipase maturation factor family protein [Planctomycetes bacterium]|nr:lipase maturation factor family protein [Planctomycetota bacterium]